MLIYQPRSAARFHVTSTEYEAPSSVTSNWNASTAVG
jgi:hypothetical protein